MRKNYQEIFKIFSYKHPALSKKCEEIFKFPLSEDDEATIFKMFDTLRYNKGVYEKRALGLSAPQVGIFKKALIIGRSSMGGRSMSALINPEIVDKSKETYDEYEGCLSIPKVLALVERSKKIVVQYKNLNGKLIKLESQDLEARIIQHEIDHLEGFTMLTKAKHITDNELYLEFKEKMKQKNIPYNSDEDL